MTNVFDRLVQLGSVPESGVYLRSACDDTVIKQLQSDAQRSLGEEVPESYTDLLRITNGVQINGAYFKEAENLVPENLDVPYSTSIVLGNEGNVAEYVFDKRDRKFHSIAMGFPDEKLAAFSTFEEMLLVILKEQL